MVSRDSLPEKYYLRRLFARNCVRSRLVGFLTNSRERSIRILRVAFVLDCRHGNTASNEFETLAPMSGDFFRAAKLAFLSLQHFVYVIVCYWKAALALWSRDRRRALRLRHHHFSPNSPNANR